MVKRINMTQLRSKLRQAQSKQRQAISRYNQKVRDLKRTIYNYNRQVRAYNARQRANQQRLRMELAKLQRQSTTRYVTFRTSVTTVHRAYTSLEESASRRALTPQENFFLDLSEREVANSIEVLNTLLDSERMPYDEGRLETLQQTSITDEIAIVSEELDSRWRGALYSLSPRNPDAARHFCASSREIFTGILELKAPDDAVLTTMPDCSTTDRGNPTRRSKIRYLLQAKEAEFGALVEFVDTDVQNILDLFDLLNAGAHGEAGQYDLCQLLAIKQRVEDGLVFLSRIAA